MIFSNLIALAVINKHGKRGVIQNSALFDPIYPCCLSKDLLIRDFLDIYLTTFLGIHNFGNTSAMRVNFFWKCSKFYLNFKNAEDNSDKSICFWNNCIWIASVNLSLLRRENLWPQVNVFPNSPKMFNITKRDFFQLNCPHIDQ